MRAARDDALVRRAGPEDAPAIGRLLHAFNSEYRDPSPGAEVLADRVAHLLETDDFTVLLAGEGPDGVAVLRFRPSIFSQALECYLAELYVSTARRGQGLGRALMEGAIEFARSHGADHMDLATAEDDRAARSLYESLGFDNHEGKPDGPVNYYYERAL